MNYDYYYYDFVADRLLVLVLVSFAVLSPTRCNLVSVVASAAGSSINCAFVRLSVLLPLLSIFCAPAVTPDAGQTSKVTW